jgi:hypothetical protein
VYVLEHSCILDLQLDAKIYPTAGCIGRGLKEEERRGAAVECPDRIVYSLLNIFVLCD